MTERLRDRLLLTMEEAAELTGLSVREVYRRVMSEEWASVKIGRLRRIRTDWLATHMERQEHGGTASLTGDRC